MLNEYYNQITPTIKVSDLVDSKELHQTLSQLDSEVLDCLETILDEYQAQTSPDPDMDMYSHVRSAAFEILSARISA